MSGVQYFLIIAGMLTAIIVPVAIYIFTGYCCCCYCDDGQYDEENPPYQDHSPGNRAPQRQDSGTGPLILGLGVLALHNL